MSHIIHNTRFLFAHSPVAALRYFLRFAGDTTVFVVCLCIWGVLWLGWL